MFHKVVWQHMQSGGIFNNQLTANLPSNLSMKKYDNPLKFDREFVASLLANPVYNKRICLSLNLRVLLLLMHGHIFLRIWTNCGV